MKTPYPHNHHLSSPFPKLFPPCCTKIKWHFHYMSIPHTFIRYLWGRILSSQTSISQRKIRKMSKCLEWGRLSGHTGVEARWEPGGETAECLPWCCSQKWSFPPPGPWDTVLHSVQGLMALLDCSFSSGPRLKQLHLSPQHLSDYLAHRCSNHVYWTKEGNWFLFHLFIIIPIFMWKWHNPFEVPSSQKKSPSLPLTRTTFFVGSLVRNLYLFYTFLLSITSPKVSLSSSDLFRNTQAFLFRDSSLWVIWLVTTSPVHLVILYYCSQVGEAEWLCHH